VSSWLARRTSMTRPSAVCVVTRGMTRGRPAGSARIRPALAALPRATSRANGTMRDVTRHPRECLRFTRKTSEQVSCRTTRLRGGSSAVRLPRFRLKSSFSEIQESFIDALSEVIPETGVSPEVALRARAACFLLMSRSLGMTCFRLVAQSISAWIFLAALVYCCGSMRPITERPLIEGSPARAMVVVLSSPYSFRHLLSTYTLPPGRYVPTLEDDAGAYFAAPAKIVSSEMLSASLIYDGGLYLRTDGSHRVDAYVIMRHQPLFVALPRDFPYALAESSSPCRN
jgi:hypothetical protein